MYKTYIPIAQMRYFRNTIVVVHQQRLHAAYEIPSTIIRRTVALRSRHSRGHRLIPRNLVVNKEQEHLPQLLAEYQFRNARSTHAGLGRNLAWRARALSASLEGGAARFRGSFELKETELSIPVGAADSRDRGTRDRAREHAW